jgi:hypothetical protein
MTTMRRMRRTRERKKRERETRREMRMRSEGCGVWGVCFVPSWAIL